MKFDAPPPTFQHSIFYLVEKAIKVYRRFAGERIRVAVPDLTINQALLLNLLAEDPDIGQKEMADVLFKDLAAVTRMVELLVKRGLVARSISPSDRRRKCLALTPLGQTTLQRVAPITAVNRRIALTGFSDDEIQELRRLLDKLITNCKTPDHV